MLRKCLDASVLFDNRRFLEVAGVHATAFLASRGGAGKGGLTAYEECSLLYYHRRRN